MAEVGFYHLTRSGLERALPALLEKVVASGMRAVVRAASEERVEALNALLWTYDQDSFLPHGSARDGDAAEQPIWLTAGDDNPNGATVLVLTDGVAAGDLAGFARCLDLFDGRDEVAVAAARDRWRACRDAGHGVLYWLQNDRGGWEKRA
ncbi:MAG: DNA polymerase III subunit chi [Alphaproteobacteria bacterium]|nr:DNA polymerase III subunit chi [Alphaproteobacteria bacterium]